MIKKGLFTFWLVSRQSVAELLKNDPLRMAGATAFFATFGIPPVIIIIVRSLGLFFNRHQMGDLLFAKLNDVIGVESAQQIRSTIRSFRALQHNSFLTVVSFIFLLFVATTLFRIVKSSLNQLWDITVSKKRNIRVRLSTRLHSIAIILFTGLLFVTVLMADAFQALLGRYLLDRPHTLFYIDSAISEVVSMAVTIVWFFVLFMYLPDGKPPRSIALTGAVITAILFRMGRFVIGVLLSVNNIGSIYGASGAMVFMLLFVFYSAIILYLGAAFTKVWGHYRKKPIKPLHYATKHTAPATPHS